MEMVCLCCWSIAPGILPLDKEASFAIIANRSVLIERICSLKRGFPKGCQI